jgi:hypothetical protein
MRWRRGVIAMLLRRVDRLLLTQLSLFEGLDELNV